MLNVLLPLCEGIAYVLIWTRIYTNTDNLPPTTFENVFFATSILGTGVLEIISGIYLVSSVSKIRAFFKERDAEE